MSALPKLGLKFDRSNSAAARTFLETLAGGPGGIFTFQTFPDRDKGDPPPAKDDPRSRILTGTFEEHARTLAALNDQRAGVFVTVNPQRGNWRGNANTIKPRAVWHENDGALPDNVAHHWPIEPSMIVKTRENRSHIYWLLDSTTGDPAEWALWEAIERHMVDKRGSDRLCQKRCQVLRLPGFYHCKDASKPRLVTLQMHDAKRRYTLDEIAVGFPPEGEQRIIEHGISQTDYDEHGIADLPIVDQVKWADIKSMLDYVNPDASAYPTGDGGDGTRTRWLKVLMALEETKHPDRRILADEWSRCGGTRDRVFPVGGPLLQHRGYVEGEVDYQMSTFKRLTGNKVGLGTLVRYAKEGGWPGWQKEDGSEPDIIEAALNAERVDVFIHTGGDEALQLKPPQQDFLLDGFIAGDDSISGILGAGGVGKSKLVKAIAASVASGTPCMGYGPLMPHIVGGTVIADLENNRHEFTRRFQDHVRAMVEHGLIPQEKAIEIMRNVRHVYINRMHWPLAFQQHGTALRHNKNYQILYDELSKARDACSMGVRWVCFDALYKFHTLNENDQSHMVMVLEQLNELSSRVFGSIPRSFVHHSKKGDTSTGSHNSTGGAARGASAITAAVRSQVVVRGLTDEETKLFGIGLTQRRDFGMVYVDKSNYRVMRPDHFMVRAYGAAWWHAGREPASMPEEDRQSYEAFLVRLYDLCIRKGIQITATSALKQYRTVLGGTRIELETWLARAEIDGYLTRGHRGRYSYVGQNFEDTARPRELDALL